MNDLFKEITDFHREEDVHARVDEAKSEYVHDWEDEFEDIHEAYDEQGRGEAESQVLWSMVNGAVAAMMPTMSSDAQIDLFEKLAEHYYLSTS